MPASMWDGPGLWMDLKKVTAKIKPDIIQAGPIQRSAFLVALAGFHPLISMSWGYDLLVDAKINRWWRWATEYTIKHSDLLIGDCEVIRRLAIGYGMHNDRIVTFPWGIDLMEFSPEPEEPNSRDVQEQSFTIISTRNWEPIYGVEVVARAFVEAAHDQPALSLIMLGNGSQADLLRELFTSGKVIDQVEFPGQINQPDLPGYYRRANLYVSASHSDGTSISLLEAMGCGIPALVSDIPGNKEWVEAGVNGWLFADGNVSQLSQSIKNAYMNRKDLPRMGTAARKIVEKRADWERNFKKMLEVYPTVLRS